MAEVDLSRVAYLEQRQNAERLYLAMLEAEKKRDDAAAAALGKDAAFQKADAEHNAASDAYWEDEGPAILTDDNDQLERCAFSGLALLVDDEVLEDPETGDKILRCLLLPPRPEMPDEDGEAEEEETPESV